MIYLPSPRLDLYPFFIFLFLFFFIYMYSGQQKIVRSFFFLVLLEKKKKEDFKINILAFTPLELRCWR